MNQGIRHDWVGDLMNVCQRLVGCTIDGNRETFAEGLERFRDALPEPRTQIERLMFRDRVSATAMSAGRACHEAFHRRSGVPLCMTSPAEVSAAVWKDSERDPRALLGDWSAAYLDAFDAHHTWPAAWRAAFQLEEHFREPLDVGQIARDLGRGRAALMRDFRRTFGVPLSDYQTTLRVRCGVVELRERGWKVEAVAWLVGYRSAKNFYNALRERAGVTPSEVRNLPEWMVQRLFDGALRLVTGEASEALRNPPGARMTQRDALELMRSP